MHRDLMMATIHAIRAVGMVHDEWMAFAPLRHS